MDGTLNVTMLVVIILSGVLLLAYWLSPRGCAFIGEYFTARSVALPRKRSAIWEARHQYRKDMVALRKGPAEVTELKRGKA